MKPAEHWASETGVPRTVVESIQTDVLRAVERACVAAQQDALWEAARRCEECARAATEQAARCDPTTCSKAAACAAEVVARFYGQTIAELLDGLRRA